MIDTPIGHPLSVRKGRPEPFRPLGLPHRWQRCFLPSLGTSAGNRVWKRAAWVRLAHIWAVGLINSGLTLRATMPAPEFWF